MRTLMPMALMIAILVSHGAVAQENVIEYSTSVDPETFTFESGKFQKDEDGEYIRDDNGALVHVRQFVTLRIEASMPCATPPDGEQIHFIADGPTWKIEEAGETRYQLKLEPSNVSIAWEQAEIAGPWEASAEVEIQIISNSKPRATLEEEYHWFAESVDIPQTCGADYSQAPDVTPHTVIIPGDAPGSGGTGGDEDGQDAPGAGLVATLGLLGVAAALRRRS